MLATTEKAKGAARPTRPQDARALKDFSTLTSVALFDINRGRALFKLIYEDEPLPPAVAAALPI
jgi:hypothetical protein